MPTTVNSTLRLSLDQEMELALAKAELEFPGLKPTQIIRTVFLRSINARSNKQNILGQIAEELGSYPESEKELNDAEYSQWWKSRKNNISKSKI